MNWENIIVAVISFAGTFMGSYSGIKLMTYRIEQLEKKVEKHNSVVERTYKLEENQAILLEKEKVSDHRITDLENEVHNK